MRATYGSWLRSFGTFGCSPRPYRHPMRKLQHLDAWRGAQQLARSAYLLTMALTVSKHFGLIDQIRRAAPSVPANIAERYALGSTPQFVRCLKIALGSATELLTHLTLLQSLNLVPEHDLQQCIELCDRVVSMIIGLIRKLTDR